MEQQARAHKVAECSAKAIKRRQPQPDFIGWEADSDLPFRRDTPEDADVLGVHLSAQARGEDELADGGGEAAGQRRSRSAIESQPRKGKDRRKGALFAYPPRKALKG